MPAPVKSSSKQSSKPASGNKPASKARGPRTCVLHLCPDLEPGDVARETVDLAILTQRSAGWRTLIASGGGALVQEAERAAVRHTRMPIGRLGMLTNWRNRVHLEALIQREHPSLVHAHGIEALSHALGLCRIHRLPLIADLTHPIEVTSRTKKLLQHIAEANALIRVPSDYLAMELREHFEVPPELILIIPPGIDLRWYDAGATSPERLHALSRLWRLPEQANVILAPMPLREGSGHKILMEALKALGRDDIYAVLVGSDREGTGMREEVEDMIGRYHLSGRVVMPDHCLDWPAAFWLSSILVAPNTEPRGQAIELLAAQAVGRPVIVTDIGANLEMVLSGETAWVVPPNDAVALADALREAIDLSSDHRVGLAERTRDFIAESFPQTAWFDAIMDACELLLRPAARAVKHKAA